MKTVLTEKQIQAYRLVDGEHGGLSTVDAAKKMGITIQALNRLLLRLKKLRPELFPILTKQEADAKALFAFDWSYADIANKLQVSLNRVSQIIGSVNEKLGTTCGRPVKMLKYEPWMDSQIRRKF